MATKRRSEDDGVTWASLPDGDADRIMRVCRRCVEEAAEHLSSRVCLRMLAIQRAIEAATSQTKTFDLDAVFGQIKKLVKELR